jgi:hypothetical protein
MKKTLILLFSLFILSKSEAQTIRCGSELNLSLIQQNDPARYQRIMDLEEHTRRYVASVRAGDNTSSRLAAPDGVIIIPVVVHVLHRGEAIGTGRNISLAQVQSQITILNEDFRRLNADQANTPAAFRAVAGDPNFEFRLACTDPDGNATEGITRTQAGLEQFTLVFNNRIVDEQATSIKFTSRGGRDAWATDRYLNIWVCDLAGGTLGYGQFPADYVAKPTTDGIVCSSYAFGNQGLVNQQLNNPFWNNGTNPYNLGRTATHEIGHWLNLRHIWGDANCGNDFVDDTPQQQGPSPSGSCPAFPRVTCNNGPDGDMFMDYTDDGCMNICTRGQGLRMRAVFADGGPRAGFINNYFRINPPTVAVCNTGTITARNPNCLPVTWAIVSGSATITGGQGTSNVNVQTTGTRGTFRIRATAANYVDEIDIGYGLPSIGGWYNSPINSSEPLAPSARTEFNWNDACYTTQINTNMELTPNSTVRWEDAGNSGGVTWSQNGNNLNFYFSDLNQYAYFRVTVTNACGSKSWLYRFRSVGDNCSGATPLRVMLSPNPTSGNLTVGLMDNAVGLTDNAIGLTNKAARLIDNAVGLTNKAVRLTNNQDNEKTKVIFEIKLLDKMGNLKQKWTYQKSDKAQLWQLNVSQLPPDFYTLMVFDGKIWIASKFIKQ